MKEAKSRDAITMVSIFGLVIAYILVIAINNILYEDRISHSFMLYCSAYGAPFIVMAGMFNQYLVRWCNKQKWVLHHEHLASVFQLLFAIFIAIFFSTFTKVCRNTQRTTSLFGRNSSCKKVNLSFSPELW